MPPELVERVVSLAVQRGHGDLAMELRGTEYAVKSVLKPGETLISAARKRGQNKPTEDIPSARTGPSLGNLPPTQRRNMLHSLLNEVLDSADEDAITAVENNLVVFVRYVRNLGTGQRNAGKKTS
jgi:hypothetical protein